MLEGVVPFPPEFAKRYRERGYWADKSLAQEFKAVFERYADRIALIDRDRSITYAELDCSSTNLALHLLGAGLVPLDRVRSEEHTSELQSHSDLHSFPTRRSSDLPDRPGPVHHVCRTRLLIDKPGPASSGRGSCAARPGGGSTAERSRICDPLLCAAKNRVHPNCGASDSPVRGGQPVRAALRRHSLRNPRPPWGLRLCVHRRSHSKGEPNAQGRDPSRRATRRVSIARGHDCHASQTSCISSHRDTD